MADSDSDDFDLMNEEISTEVYGENLNQGYGMYLGTRIKLGKFEMAELKTIIDQEINPKLTPVKAQPYSICVEDIQYMRLNPANEKLKDISVQVESIKEQILVKVGPCDLSGVGGHLVREQMIANLVNQALLEQGHDPKTTNFTTVNVSACVGVRGRAQMLFGLFANNREDAGAHMNAYVKTAGEPHLTHWEPRQGPQRFFNDTVCAMVTSTVTSLFEKRIREQTIDSSAQATNDILKKPSLVIIFDAILSSTKDRIVLLVNGIKAMLARDEPNAEPEARTLGS